MAPPPSTGAPTIAPNAVVKSRESIAGGVLSAYTRAGLWPTAKNKALVTDTADTMPITKRVSCHHLYRRRTACHRLVATLDVAVGFSRALSVMCTESVRIHTP